MNNGQNIIPRLKHIDELIKSALKQGQYINHFKIEKKLREDMLEQEAELEDQENKKNNPEKSRKKKEQAEERKEKFAQKLKDKKLIIE